MTQSIREIFSAAIEIQSTDERRKYLDEACGGDSVLRDEIEALIQAHLQAGSFFVEDEEPDNPALDDTVQRPRADDTAGNTVGPYKLLQQIGEGGMGSVWMAEQQEPVRRMVALKIIKAGMDSSQVIARFEAERQALALMNHPNIAKVLDAGTTDNGRPFFVMELVKGVRITEFCDKNKYPPAERLKLFIDVCRAVQHAHHKGIIHRDIKPSNVMVTLHDTVPVVKVIDFGLAKATAQKLTERTLFTAYGQMVGTPSYMSPEQAEMSGLDVDTRTDVYSLGVLLYELMTGTTPIDANSLRKAGFVEIQRLIQEEEAPPMSTRLSSMGGSSSVIAGKRGSDVNRLSQLFRGDLDVIVLKSLDKDRSRRYPTPNDFAEDIQRFLTNEPIEARPASTAYRLKKLYQRNRAAVLTIATVACILVLATIFSTSQAIRASTVASKLAREQQKTLAEQQRTLAALDKAATAEAEQRRLRQETDQTNTELLKANQNLEHSIYVSKIHEADAQLISGDYRAAQNTLTSIPLDQRNWEARYLLRIAIGTPLTIGDDQGEVHSVSFSPDGKSIVGGMSDGAVRFWDANTGKEKRAFLVTDGPVTDMAISPDGKWIASCSYDVGGQDEIKLWDATTGEVKRTILAHNTVVHLGFSPDGARLLSSGNDGDGNAVADARLKVWDAETGELLKSIDGVARHVAISPDGKQVITGRSVWDATTGEVQLTLPMGEPSVSLAAWSPDGNWIAIYDGAVKGAVKVVDARTGEEKWASHELKLHVECLAFSPDGQWIAAGGNDKIIKSWDVHTGNESRALMGHHGFIYNISFSPDGTRIASSDGYINRTAKIWDVTSEKRQLVLKGHSGAVNSVAFTADGTHIVSAGNDRTVRIWDAGTGEQLRSLRGHKSSVSSVACSPDGKLIASGSHDKTIRVWDALTGKEKRAIRVTDSRLIAISPCVAFSPDGKWIASAIHGGRTIDNQDFMHEVSIALWDAQTGEKKVGEERLLNLGKDIQGWASIAFSPSGEMILFVGRHCFDPITGDHRFSLPRSSSIAWTTRLSADGTQAATPMQFGTVKLWDASSLENLLTLGEADGRHTKYVAFSPDGRRICSGSVGGRINVWDAGSRETADGFGGEKDGDPWAENARRLEYYAPVWHRQNAAQAEQDENWFAARFHLRCLAKYQPDDEELLERLRRAEDAWEEESNEDH